MVTFRIVRNSFTGLGVLLAFVLSLSVQASTFDDRATWSRMQWEGVDDFQFGDRAFSSGASWFNAGPAWLMNAMPGSNRTHSRYVIDRSGDLVESTPQYNDYVGTLRDAFDVSLLSSADAFRLNSASGYQISSPAPDAILANGTWDGGTNGNGTAWLTTTNWVGDAAFPGSTSVTTNTDIASIPSTGTNPNIGINGTTAPNFYLGAIDFSSASRAIGDSAGGNLTLTLNGATIGVPNVILHNSGAGTLTLQPQAGGAGTMSVALGNATDNIINIDSTGGITVSSVIKDGTGSHISKGGTGSGVLTFSGANTYTGGTAVSSGTLLVINTTGSGTGTGSVVVNNAGSVLAGGTTNGAGGISGSVAINPGATLSPGTSGSGAGNTAILNTGALTLVTASNFNVDLNGTTAGTGYDQLKVTGLVNVSGSNLAVTVGGSLAIGNKFFITLNDGTDLVTGTFAQGATVTANNGYTFLINYLDNGDGGTVGNDISLTLTSIPEASTWIGAALALGAIGFTQRRRFRGLIARRA